LWVEATDSDLGSAATTVRRKYPNFNVAQKAKNPSFLDAHPSGALATGHAELKGFGVTMVQGKWPDPVDNASGRLDDPTLLFFQKDGKKQDDWAIIGLGYSFALDRDGENAPHNMPAIPAFKWFVHEAGDLQKPGREGHDLIYCGVGRGEGSDGSAGWIVRRRGAACWSVEEG
jgi:hypothetical protein